MDSEATKSDPISISMKLYLCKRTAEKFSDNLDEKKVTKSESFECPQ